MLNDKSRMKSGNMETELSARVDGLLDEFIAIVDSMTEERHLQKGIARSQLPSSMVAILDRDSLTILGQFRMQNRTASYFYRPDIALNAQQAAQSAQWEFGFDDPFIIQFPAILLDQNGQDRKAALEAVAAKHIASEHLRLEEKLSLMRHRPIFGPAAEPVMAKTLLLLRPEKRGDPGIEEAIISALSAQNLAYEDAPDIRNGRAAVREMWQNINYAAVILADLTGADPQVMYGLGMAHTLGKETVLIYPQGSSYLTDLPRVERIEYESSEAGMVRLSEELDRMLGRILAPILEE
ncbi:MAG: hypothetical protein LUQ44_02340 [Methanothrix sp.]|nr:hypothetical protein [Methanothrix sp.]MDD1759423.1 hypothetical protein [Methanothrix sp.]